MGANAQTSVPTFTAGEVLTAANMNISARTGVPVFADGTARDAAFGGSGEKTLAEGQLAYLENSNVVQYYDGASWATVGPATAGALTLISATTIGSAVSSVTVSSVFSSTYDVYLVTISGGVASTSNNIGLQLGATTTGYKFGYGATTFSAPAYSADGSTNATSLRYVGTGSTDSLYGYFVVNGPNLAKFTRYYSLTVFSGETGFAGGVIENTTQYTAFTLVTSSGTLTGGTIRVYGYANS